MSGEGSSSKSREEVNHFPGLYQFTVHPGIQDDESQSIQKNVEYTFSTKLNRLFVKKMAVCPFGIFTSATPPANSQVKIYVYSEDNVPVMRCRAHTEGSDQEDFVAPLHYMRCQNSKAIYDCHSTTGELSILFPYIKPEVVTENIENLTFLCSTKYCIKKELFIKFVLINRDEVLGSHVFGLHVCSTPGRDRINHESGKKMKSRRKRKMPAESDEKQYLPIDIISNLNTTSYSFIRLGSDYSTETVIPPSQEIFKIAVKERWIYEYLVKINRGLELVDAVPLHLQEHYLKKYRAKQVTSSHTESTHTVTAASTSCDHTRSSETRSTLRRILVKS